MESFAQRKIDTLFFENRNRYEEYMDIIRDIFYEIIDKVGHYENMPIRKRFYHGCYKLAYKAADKITLDRYNTSFNYSLPILPIHEDKSEFNKNIVCKMFCKCLEVPNNSSASTRELFYEFLLFCLGDKDYRTLNENITDEMLTFWNDNFKIAYLLFSPTNLFTKHFFDIGDFNVFYNQSKDLLADFISDLNIDKMDYLSYLSLKLELFLYAPYITNLKKYNK